jgi:nicotinate-nucleotide pyrophosphorylase (carboxylating)
MTASERDLIYGIVDKALEEDLSIEGDITSQAVFSSDDFTEAIIRSKSSGVLSGTALAEAVFRRCDERIAYTPNRTDGEPLDAGTVIGAVSGPVRGILTAERTVLNFIQRLSGIATRTAEFTAAIAHTSARLLDTRKTTPGLRYFEKQAVRHGGGSNHRFGLFDMVLIKDTHVRRAGGAVRALEKVFAWRGNSTTPPVEIEVQTIDEFTDILEMRPERIMLDNMKINVIKKCVEIRNERQPSVGLEASGNITLQNVAEVAGTGVDFISVGALTHSAPALDIHLLIS